MYNKLPTKKRVDVVKLCKDLLLFSTQCATPDDKAEAAICGSVGVSLLEDSLGVDRGTLAKAVNRKTEVPS